MKKLELEQVLDNLFSSVNDETPEEIRQQIRLKYTLLEQEYLERFGHYYEPTETFK